MSEYITVRQTVKIRKSCRNCLFCGTDGISCDNANNSGAIMVAVNGGRACEWYELDGYRFQEIAERRKGVGG